MGVIDDLGPGPVAIDTAPFIYLIEEHPRFLDVVRPVFEAIARGELQAVASELTLLEVLVVPYRVGDAALATRYEDLLSGSRGLTLVGLDRDLLREAARLRATMGLKTPDAIQAATALRVGCSALLTNDRDFGRLPGVRVVQIGEYAR